MFFVTKKNKKLRLIIDARCTNAPHRPPPRTSLATPGPCWASSWRAERRRIFMNPQSIFRMDSISCLARQWPSCLVLMWRSGRTLCFLSVFMCLFVSGEKEAGLATVETWEFAGLVVAKA